MPKVTTLVCDDCHSIQDIDPTVAERDSKTVLCDTCADVRRRRRAGEPVFAPTEGYSQSRPDINYDNAYPSMEEVSYSCEVESAVEVGFLGHTLTPEEALEAIDTIKGVSVEDFAPSWGAHPDINWEVRVYWREVPIDIAEDAVDEFLKPALGLIDDNGQAVDPPWLVPQIQ
jgi:hypothetical protein